jgi:anti-sigma28 factor (negative regulator of flagellin synthesis)
MPIRKLKHSISPAPIRGHQSGTHRISARRVQTDNQPFDVAKVNRLRRLIEAGELTLDAELIAEKIVG